MEINNLILKEIDNLLDHDKLKLSKNFEKNMRMQYQMQMH